MFITISSNNLGKSGTVLVHTFVLMASIRTKWMCTIKRVKTGNFFRLLFPDCINWWAHGEDRAIAFRQLILFPMHVFFFLSLEQSKEGLALVVIE